MKHNKSSTIKRNPVTVILEDIRSALNVGAIFRTCEAVLVQQLILTGITPYPPHNKIPKTALGAIENVPWNYEKDKSKIIDKMSKEMDLVAIEITESATDLYKYNFPKNIGIILGNEISGISNETLKKCVTTIKIPMYGQKESLNVATSCGIVLYEIIRQWHFSK